MPNILNVHYRICSNENEQLKRALKIPLGEFDYLPVNSTSSLHNLPVNIIFMSLPISQENLY